MSWRHAATRTWPIVTAASHFLTVPNFSFSIHRSYIFASSLLHQTSTLNKNLTKTNFSHLWIEPNPRSAIDMDDQDQSVFDPQFSCSSSSLTVTPTDIFI